MKTRFLACLLAGFLNCLLNTLPAYSAEHCYSHEADISHLNSNFDELYMRNNTEFWHTFNCAANEAAACTRLDATANFFMLAKSISGNAEAKEAFMHIVEIDIISKNPECFANSLSLVDTDAATIILTDLRNPLYIDKSYVAKMMHELSANKKYTTLLLPYFKKQ